MLLDELKGAAIITVAILGCFLLCEVVRRVFHVRGEVTRKTSHVGAGVVVLFIPVLLHSLWTVIVLAGGFALLLTAGKVLGFLQSVHDVERRTYGAYVYPLAVVLTYVLADGEPLLFQVPILVMALSDTVAALVGQRAGSVTYRVAGGTRSLEGSAAFLGLTFLLVMAALVVSGRGVWPDLLLITLLVALVATAVEAVSVLGFDNLLIPYAVVFLLSRTLGLDLPALGDWVLGLVMVTGLVLATAWRARLVASGFVLIALVGYLTWVLGGPAWFTPLALLYLGWVAVRDPKDVPEGGVDVTVVFPITITSFALVLGFSHTGWAALYVPFLVSAGINSAIAWATFARRRGLPELPAALAGAALPLAVLPFVETPLVVGAGGLAVVLAAGGLGYGLYRGLKTTGLAQRARLLSTAGGSAVGFLSLVF